MMAILMKPWHGMAWQFGGVEDDVGVGDDDDDDEWEWGYLVERER
jgi:hypothetical protein